MGFLQGGKLMDTVEAVAQAIFAADPAGAKLVGRAWTEVDEWDRKSYRNLARAAIDALGLTEETRGMVACECGHPRIDHRPADLGPFRCYGRQGKCGCKTWSRRLQSRLVSGWVRKDNTNE